jgi:dipeptidyl aminopeptidase/acylaminoacyl peptidase
MRKRENGLEQRYLTSGMLVCCLFLSMCGSLANAGPRSPAPDWVSTLALRIVQETIDDEINAEDLELSRTFHGHAVENRVEYALSPDGNSVGIRTGANPRYAETLWVASRDTMEKTRLLTSRWGMGAPKWSPDGKKMACVFRHFDQLNLVTPIPDDGDFRGYSLVVADVATGATREITPRWYYSREGFHPIAWSPDGGSVAFSGPFEPLSAPGDSEELYLVDVSSASPTIRRLTYNDVEDKDPTFSPQGDRIAFTRWILPQAVDQFLVLDLATAEEHLLAGGEYREGTRWRLSAGGGVEWWPDGNGIDFWARWKGGPPPRYIRYSYNLVTGASEVIETR